METRIESFFYGLNDAKLYYQKWMSKKPNGIVVITHGQGEHSDSYGRLIKALLPSDFIIYAWDWRGHGRSEGQRGYAKHFNDYVQDFEMFLNHIFNVQSAIKRPVFLVGHSMGALIQLKALCSKINFKIEAQVLSAPFLGLSLNVPQYKLTASQFILKYFPKMTLWNEIKNEDLTRDPEVINEYTKDVLRNDRISAGVFLGALEAMDFVEQRAALLTVPTLIQMSDCDPIASVDKTKIFFESLASEKKKIIFYTDNKHEIFNDLDREKVFRDLNQFLGKFL